MNSTLDIVNVLEFLKNMPLEPKSEIQIIGASSAQFEGDHIIRLEVQILDTQWNHTLFYFRVDPYGALRISHGHCPPIHPSRIKVAAEAVQQQYRKRVPLGIVQACLLMGRPAIMAEYALQLDDEWFAGTLRPACARLLTNTMKTLYLNVINVTTAIKK